MVTLLGDSANNLDLCAETDDDELRGAGRRPDGGGGGGAGVNGGKTDICTRDDTGNGLRPTRIEFTPP